MIHDKYAKKNVMIIAKTAQSRSDVLMRRTTVENNPSTQRCRNVPPTIFVSQKIVNVITKTNMETHVNGNAL
jgi:uncharacterized protein (UPF0276 family)